MYACAVLLALSAQVCTGSAPGVEGQDEPTLIADGRSDYRIVIPDEQSPVTRFAARELRDLLLAMSGVKLRIVRERNAGSRPGIYLGPCVRTQALVRPDELSRLGNDGVIIRTDGPDLLLIGSNDRGHLYAVYELLERFLGVRFLARDCTVIPTRPTVTLPPIDHTHTPPFMYRETLYFDSFPRQIAARQRLNGPATECDESTGGKIAFHPYVHSFAKLVPPDEYFDEHPEYFSLVGGKRTRATVHGQLCLTNPDVLKIATERVLEWVRDNPQVPIFDVSQNDGNGACECEACAAVVAQEGSQHGPILRFVNAIAEEVAKEHPDKWIETLAYAYSVTPPKITKPRDNVLIRLCHAGCYFHGFEECGLGANLSGNLQAWNALTDRIFIWHYATNFAHYLAPNQNLMGLAKDIAYYASHGVRGLMVQGDYQSPGGELAELRQYLSAQLMWDPTRDPMAIREEFCRGYYGDAAQSVLQYLALLDEAAQKPDVHAFGAWDPQSTFPPELLAKAMPIVSAAQAQAEGSVVRARVDRLLLPLWYMQLSYLDRYGLAPADAGAVVAQFRAVVEASGITHVREGGSNIESWLSGMEALYAEMDESVVLDLCLAMGSAELADCRDWRRATVLHEGVPQASLFQHPPGEGQARATYSVTLPDCPAGGRLSLSFRTAITAPSDDGVRFSARLDDEQVWSHTQTAQPCVPHTIDLTAFAGKTLSLTLCTEAIGNDTHDWANWVRPRVVLE